LCVVANDHRITSSARELERVNAVRDASVDHERGVDPWCALQAMNDPSADEAGADHGDVGFFTGV
jgi:hypothetical protein